MTEVNEIAILVSALLALALGSIWYSPLVFGKYWQRAVGMSDADLSLTSSELARSLVAGLVSNAVILFLLAHLIRIADAHSYTYTSVVMSGVIFIAASVGSMVVWERKTWMYFCIHTGYASLVILMGVTVLAYWPW